MKGIQISTKNQTKLSIEAKTLFAEHDIAFEKSKTSKNIEDIREYKNIKKYTNSVISKERFKRKVNKFKDENSTIKEKWKFSKEETGQN